MRQLLFLIGLCILCTCSATAQDVQGVYSESHPAEVGVGYTFFRFYEVPSTTPNFNGITFSGAYYMRKWVAADAEVTDSFRTQAGQNSQLLFAGGGVRFCYPASRALRLWVHGLAGHSHFTPKTAYGSESALGFEAGAGIDLRYRHSPFALRLSADMVGTRFFGTTQYSPKATVGVVYRF